MSWLVDFKKLIFEPTQFRKTGYEELSENDFLNKCEAWHPFHRVSDSKLIPGISATLLSDEMVKCEALSKFWDEIRKRTEGKPICELGVRAKEERHRALFPQVFGCSEYVGINTQNFGNPQILVTDYLRWATQAPDNSACIAAFGLFSGQLSPSSSLTTWMLGFGTDGYFLPAFSPNWRSLPQFEHEYLRRLAIELYRIVPEGGAFLGDGLYWRSQGRHFLKYLLDAGFEFMNELGELYRNSLTSPAAKKPKRLPSQPFFFVKISKK